MLVEICTITCHPGRLAAFLDLFEAAAQALEDRHCGPLTASLTAETGLLNQLMQIRCYRDGADRDARRAALAADPAWPALFDALLPFMQGQEVRLMKPTRASPLR
jgi:hypothetical protein